MHHKHHSAWCAYMSFLLKERKLNQSSFADLLRIKPQVVQTYISGRSKPPLEELSHWCETLKLSKAESEKMRWLALESYTPSVVWEKIAALDLDVANLRQEKVELSAEIGKLRADNAGLRGERDNLAAKIAELTKRLAGIAGQ